MQQLDDSNFMLYAAANYDNPQCYDTDEFYDDLKRFKYLKRLLNRYKETGELKERLILNHLTVIYNVFGSTPATRLLFFKLFNSFRAARVKSIDDEPELTNIEYFVLIVLAHFSSNSHVSSPLVRRGILS